MFLIIWHIKALKSEAFQLKQKVLHSLSIFCNSVKASKRWKIVWNFGLMSKVITLKKTFPSTTYKNSYKYTR